MGERRLRSQVTQVLEDPQYGFKVDTDKKYHGIKVDVLAQNEQLGRTIFMYVADARKSDPLDVIGLYTLRQGNNDVLKKYDCEYYILSEAEPDDTVKDLSDANDIPILRNIHELKEKLSHPHHL